MASHHHHHHHHHPCHQAIATSTATASYCCCYYSNYTPFYHPLPPDPHLPPVSHHLHHPPPPPQPHHYFQDVPHRHHHYEEQQQTQPIIYTLLRRISALEASFKRSSSSSSSLHDAAARVIQTHFRAFLVRRSTTLGQLKELASIKSTVNALKSSVSDNVHLDSHALSLKIMDLLLRLDSIQGCDSMIRDGKRSISRELNRLMELIDGVCVKKSGLSSRLVRNVRCEGDNSNSKVLCSDQKRGTIDSVKLAKRADVTDKLREQTRRINELDLLNEEDDEEYQDLVKLNTFLERKNGVPVSRSGGLRKGHGGAQAKVKKSVSFAENGNVYRVIRSGNEPVSNGDCDSINGTNSVDADQELIQKHSREI